jgi:Ca2+-binding EF-hand superfamily protein
MSYSTKGQDPASLFMLYDRNHSGSLQLAEFRSAVRKGGQLTSATISDAALETLFSSVPDPQHSCLIFKVNCLTNLLILRLSLDMSVLLSR